MYNIGTGPATAATCQSFPSIMYLVHGAVVRVICSVRARVGCFTTVIITKNCCLISALIGVVVSFGIIATCCIYSQLPEARGFLRLRCEAVMHCVERLDPIGEKLTPLVWLVQNISLPEGRPPLFRHDDGVACRTAQIGEGVPFDVDDRLPQVFVML
jgi:hypothetical protein